MRKRYSTLSITNVKIINEFVMRIYENLIYVMVRLFNHSRVAYVYLLDDI